LNTLESSKGEESSVSILRNKKLMAVNILCQIWTDTKQNKHTVRCWSPAIGRLVAETAIGRFDIPLSWYCYLGKDESVLPQEIRDYIGSKIDYRYDGSWDVVRQLFYDTSEWSRISAEAKKRGFDAYPPDSHCPSLDHVRFLIVLNFHPTGIHDGSRPMTLGADGLFSQPSLRAIVQTMINYMVVEGFKKDVAQALIMTSIVVMDTVWSDGPSQWHEKGKDSFDSVIVRTKNDIQTVVKRILIDQCANLCGCIVMGESPKEHMGPWLEKMAVSTPNPFIVTYGTHPQNIFLMWYDSKQRVELLDSIASLLKRVGVPSPPKPFLSSFQHLCSRYH
jgi:hypothetical protein